MVGLLLALTPLSQAVTADAFPGGGEEVVDQCEDLLDCAVPSCDFHQWVPPRMDCYWLGHYVFSFQQHGRFACLHWPVEYCIPPGPPG